MSELKLQQRIALADFQRAYLSAAASAGGREYSIGRFDLLIRQSAARGAALLKRCTELRPQDQSSPVGLLMDRIEVTLTKLDLLDPANMPEADAFASMLRQSGLLGEIQTTLAEGRTSGEVRTWLMEVRMILEGAENVG
jgi:hypothetical protein